MASRTGVHLMRDPLDYLAEVGFHVEQCARSKGGIIEDVVARKASSTTLATAVCPGPAAERSESVD
jgi:hypothetical protein